MSSSSSRSPSSSPSRSPFASRQALDPRDVDPLRIEPDPPAETIKEIEARKASLNDAKAAQFAAGAPVHTRRFVHRESRDPSSPAEAALDAIKEHDRATRRMGRPPHDRDLIYRLIDENPDATQAKIAELYTQASGRALTAMGISNILANERARNGVIKSRRGNPENAPHASVSLESLSSIPLPSVSAPDSSPAHEFAAMNAVLSTLAGLDDDTAARVLLWAGWRRGVFVVPTSGFTAP